MDIQVIYDLSGKIITTRGGSPLPQSPEGVPCLEATVPTGKILVGVDVSKNPHEAIFETLPPSELEVLKNDLENTKKDLDNALIELTTLIGMGGI